MADQQTYRVTLSDGRVFDVTTEGGPPSEADVLANLDTLASSAPEPEGARPETPRAVHPYQRLADMATGAVKGLGETATSLAKMFSMANPTATSFEAAKPNSLFDQAQARLQPTNAAQQVGKTGERIAEFMTPVGVESKLAGLAPKGANVATRMAARMAGSGAEMGLKGAAQTADPEEALQAALMGGVAEPVGAVLKSVGKTLFARLPERLYGQVFKLAEDDLRAAYKATAQGAAPNPTLAKEALERGLMGSSSNMAVYSLKKLDRLENDLQSTLAGRFVRLPKKTEYINLLRSLVDEFGGAFAETGVKAKALLERIEGGIRGPYVRAEDALSLKRLLDGARNTSAFRMSAKLSPKQDEYKHAADLVRGTIKGSFPNAAKLLDEERIFIQAVDAVVKDAVQRNNRRLLGLTDYVLGGGGMASGFGFGGVGAAATVRGFQNPFTLTGLGQGLFRSGQMLPPVEPITRGVAGAAATQGR